MLFKRGDGALTRLPGNRVAWIGGKTTTTDKSDIALNDMMVYMSEVQFWTLSMPIPAGRSRFGAAFLGMDTGLYTFGGRRYNLILH